MLAERHVATTALRELRRADVAAIDVLAPGAQSSLQELPGRLGYWHVGVPPSGPMDARSFRLANALVGNAPETAALELTVSGPTLRFNTERDRRAGGRPHDGRRSTASPAPHDAAGRGRAPARC